MPRPRSSCVSVVYPRAASLVSPALVLATIALTVLALSPRAVSAQLRSRADSALVVRILRAEDRRDSTDAALEEGARHADARIKTLAQRARGRIVDAKLAARTALPPLASSPVWPEPAWRLRFRALPAQRDDCAAMRTALTDSSWMVRMRASDLLRASCAGDNAIRATLVAWVDQLPEHARARATGTVSWQGAAHAVVALARVYPADAPPRIARLATHATWGVRQYAARAAGLIGDTARLRALAHDVNDNVAETAIEQLSRLSSHADDAIFLAALERRGAQVVKTAATALKDSPHPDAPAAARAAFERFVARDNASERDARIALLAVAGLGPEADRAPSTRITLEIAELSDAVALALGADIRLRVTMDTAAGGGEFTVRLRGDAAPIMAARILALARRGYYDGLTWHRVEHDFVIQGGSPGSNEYVGADRYLRDELGGVSHLRGTVGMSTRGHDTGDAQWFVNLRDNSRLDADYTVWAEVIEGIGVVDAILEGDRIARIVEMRP